MLGLMMEEADVSLGPRGLSLRVCRWGDRGPTVVILHGYLEQGAAWGPVAERLVARGARVVAPDHRGHGRSPGAPPGFRYHFWDYVADVDALVRALGPGPIDLVGHSMGGTIAAVFAGARPDRVRRLVLVEGLGPPDTRSVAVQRGRAFLDDLEAQRAHAPIDDVAAAAKKMRRMAPSLPEALLPQLAARLTEPGPDGKLRWTWDPLHRVTFPYPFDEVVFRAWLAEITAPVLAVRGDASPYGTFSLDRAQSIADVRHLVLPGVGHMVHHDAPGPLAGAIGDFFGYELPQGSP